MTEYIPKPLVTIGSRPIIWHIMKTYARYGFKDFILCLGYKGNMIKEYFVHHDWMNNDFMLDLSSNQKKVFTDNRDMEDWKVTFVDTGQDTMTGGRLKRVRPDVAAEARRLIQRDSPVYSGHHFAALKRMLDREEPDYKR